MIYNSFGNLNISALGLGSMRLPVLDEDDARIDVDAARAMVAYAMEHGINYYDTAYGYHGGNSETVMGELLKEYPRESFFLSSKFPGYDLANIPKVQEIFEEQLEKCQVDYFDFYFFHNVCELNVDSYLNPEFGIYDYLLEQKRNGRIKHLGFSAHGGVECVKKFLDAYGKDMEFGMIELNYFDYEFQDAKGKLALLKERGIPVWVMEPLRGGQLAALPEEYSAKLRAARPEESVPAWAFRFLQGIPEVVVTLSGMSNMQQLQDNIATFEKSRPLSAQEACLVLDIAREMVAKTAIPCTACHYCVSKCPQELDIPFLLKAYNESLVEGPGWFITPMALGSLEANKQPECCIGCGSCESVCPQNIAISKHLADFAQHMGR